MLLTLLFAVPSLDYHVLAGSCYSHAQSTSPSRANPEKTRNLILTSASRNLTTAQLSMRLHIFEKVAHFLGKGRGAWPFRRRFRPLSRCCI
jgi:hypothetical protein